MSDCLTLAADGHADALLEHVPDGVLDRCIAQRKSARCDFGFEGITLHIFGKPVVAQPSELEATAGPKRQAYG